MPDPFSELQKKRKKIPNKAKKTVELFRDNYAYCFLFTELREQKNKISVKSESKA